MFESFLTALGVALAAAIWLMVFLFLRVGVSVEDLAILASARRRFPFDGEFSLVPGPAQRKLTAAR